MSNNPNSGNSPNQNPVTPSPASGKSSYQNLLWVVIVLLVGTVAGFIIFVVIASHLNFGVGPPPRGLGGRIGAYVITYLAVHIILSTVSVALLLSLVIVYSRIYNQTRANFALGIFIVLLALLFQAILNSPVLQLYTASGFRVALNASPLPTLADLLTIVAYMIFLYLSLE